MIEKLGLREQASNGLYMCSYLTVHQPPCYMLSCLGVSVFAHMCSCLSVYPSTVCICLSVCPSVCLSICFSVFVCFFCLSIYLSVCLSVCLSVYLSTCLPVCLSACRPVCLFIYLSAYRSSAQLHLFIYQLLICLLHALLLHRSLSLQNLFYWQSWCV